MAEYYSIVQSQILCIHSSVVVHCDFPLWAIMTNFSDNIHVQVLPRNMFLFFFGTYLKMELLGRGLTLCLIFWGTEVVFINNCPASFYISLSGITLCFFTSSSNLLLSLFFVYYSNPSVCEMASHCFDMILLIVNYNEYFLMTKLTICMFYGEMFIQ